MHWIKFCVAILMLACADCVCASEDILVITENTPPFTTIENGQIAGYATIPVRAIIERAGYQANFKMLSWKAATDLVERTPGALIYPIARTREREAQYRWIARIGQTEFFVYKLRNRPIEAPARLGALVHYRIAAIRNDVRREFLEAAGFSEDGKSGIIDVADNVEAMRQLHAGRVDFAIFAPSGLPQNCDSLHFNCNDFEKFIPLGLTTDVYLAASLHAPDPEIRRLQDAYQALKQDGTLRRIMNSRLENSK